MTNEEIISGIKQQDTAIERIFYLANRSLCIQYAEKHFFWKRKNGTSLKCTDEDAAELYNDACVLFIQNILRNRITSLEAKISTYLVTTMKYQWYNKARANKLDTIGEKETIIGADPKSSVTPDTETVRDGVRKAIQRLDDKCREMMTYRYILGWEDYEDIAQATGKNNGAVIRNLISRCRKRFRTIYLQLTQEESSTNPKPL